MRFRFTIRDSETLISAVPLILWTAVGHAADPTSHLTGTLTGRFVYDGKAPKPKEISTTENDLRNRPRERPDANLIREYNPVDESLLVNEGGGLENVLVWVRSKDIPTRAIEQRDPPTLQFKEARLVPHVLVFQVPQDVVLKNEDPQSICDFSFLSYEGTASSRVPPQEQRSITMSKTETVANQPTPVRVDSHTQTWLKAYMLPLANPHFATTDKDGKFKIENLPPGKWEFQTWHERAGYLKAKDWQRGRFTLQIKPGETIDLGDIKLDPAQFNK